MAKIHYLYMDTSDHLVVGLLDESFAWVDFLELEGAKNSGKIHAAIYSMVIKNGLQPHELKGIFQNAGPGSYTGMRVSEGISQIFEWQGIPIYSFYHFEVPELLGLTEGQWLAKAFKGEFFLATWAEGQRATQLLNPDQVKVKIQQGKVYCHFRKSLEKDFPTELSTFAETGELIKAQGQKIFPLVLNRQSRLSPYYFRTVDQEFKVSR